MPQQQRRTPSGRPGARPTGGRGRVRSRQAAGATRQAKPTTPRAAAAAAAARRTAARPVARPHRSRFTGRAAVMVLVLAVLTISYASSLKAYFQQRGQIQTLKSQIASSEASINSLETEKERFQDPAYVREQARARFGYLMPGQTSYVVIGADGKPLAAQATLNDPRTRSTTTPTAWWTTEWKSVELAGNPPTKHAPQPLSYIGTHSR